MLVHRISNQLLTTPDLRMPVKQLREGKDVSIGIAQSGRALLTAAIWADDPRPCLLVMPGEEAADRMAQALSTWLGVGAVMRYPVRTDLPWSEKPADDGVIGARCAAVECLAAGKNCVVVASARSLMRRVPPVGSGY